MHTHTFSVLSSRVDGFSSSHVELARQNASGGRFLSTQRPPGWRQGLQGKPERRSDLDTNLGIAVSSNG